MSDASYVETIIDLRQALDDAQAEIDRLNDHIATDIGHIKSLTEALNAVKSELAETEEAHVAAEHRAQTAEVEVERLRAGIEALIKDYVDVFDPLTEERSWTMTKAYLQRLLDGEPK